MRSPNPISLLLFVSLCWVMAAGTLSAQSEAPPASPVPSLNPTPAPAPASPNPTVSTSPSGYLEGNWKIERAIFELFGNLKEVTAIDDRFYSRLTLGPGGKGGIRYGTRTVDAEIEYEMKSNQNLTIAFGSRLKPQVDLYQTLMLADGSLYLRSTRLAGVNGTVYYFLRKINP